MALFCVIGVLLGRMQTSARNAGRVDVVGEIAQSAVRPISMSCERITSSTSDFFAGLFSANKLSAENRALRAKVMALSLYDVQVSRLEYEVDALRKATKFGDAPGKTRVPTDVIGWAPYENRIILSVGRNEGIEPGMPVVNTDGLVGLVQSVGSKDCQVALLTTFGQQLGGVDTTRKPPTAGMVRGRDNSSLQITFLDPKAPVVSGDSIFTGAFSPRVPPGIYIGRVIDVKDDEAFGIRRANVDPAVNMGTLREVWILK